MTGYSPRYIKEKRANCNAYSAANVFLIPSREDNLPNTMLESLCCGTPVIGTEPVDNRMRYSRRKWIFKQKKKGNTNC